MATEEQRKKMQEIANARRKRMVEAESKAPTQGTPFQKYVADPFEKYVTDPFLKPIWDRYSRIEDYGGTELTKQQVEEQEYWEEKGLPKGMAQGYFKPILNSAGDIQFVKNPVQEDYDYQAQELASDFLGFPSMLTGGKISDEWSKSIDPSKNTELGMLSDSKLKEFESVNRRKPNFMEKIDIYKQAQDEYDPRLKKIRDANTQAALAGSVIVEGGVIGGLAKAAKVVKAANTARIANNTTKGPIRAANYALEKSLDAIPAVDRAFGSLVGAVLKGGYGFTKLAVGKPIVATTQFSKGFVDKLIDRFKRKVEENELPVAEADKISIKTTNDLARNNKIKGVKPGENYVSYNNEIDAPKKREPRPKGNQEEYREQSVKDNPFGIKKGKVSSPSSGDLTKMRFSSFTPKNIRRQYLNKNTFDVPNEVAVAYQDNARELIREALNKYESWIELTASNRATIISFIKEESPNLLVEDSIGGTLSKVPGISKFEKAKRFESEPINTHFTDEWHKKNFPNNPEIRMTGRKNPTPIMDPDDPLYDSNDIIYETVDDYTIDPMTGKILSQKEERPRHIKLNPSLDNIIKGGAKWKEPLSVVEYTVDREMLRKWGGKYFSKIEGEIEPLKTNAVLGEYKLGDKFTAYDLVLKLIKQNDQLEKHLIKLRASGAGTGRDTLYRQGGAHSSLSVHPSTKDIKGDLRAKERAKLEKEFFNFDNYDNIRPDPVRDLKVREIGKRVFAGGADGMAHGMKYKGDVAAFVDSARYVLRKELGEKLEELTFETAEQNNFKYGTVHQLLGDNFYKEINRLLRGISTVLRRGSSKTKDSEIIKKVEELISDMHIASESSRFKKDNIEDTIVKLTENEISELKRNFNNFKKSSEEIIKDWDKSDIKVIRNSFKSVSDSLDKETSNVLEDMEQLNFSGHEDYYFPKQMYDAITEVHEEVDKDLLMDPDYIKLITSSLKMAQTTADMGQMGIQLLSFQAEYVSRMPRALLTQTPVMGLNRNAPISALKYLVKSLWEKPEKVMGDFYNIKRVSAKENGLPTPENWASEGLVLISGIRDVTSPRTLKLFSKIPLIKSVVNYFNKGFANTTNIYRYDFAEMELESAMVREGKSWKQLQSEGAMEEISNAMNKISGIGRRNFGGEIGFHALYSGSFFQSRFAYFNNVLKGFIKTATPGFQAKREEAISLKYMSKLMGMTVLMTVGVNTARNEETDFSPMVQNKSTGKWYFNPDFLVMHAGDLDIKLLGTWDGFLRLMLMSTWGQKNKLPLIEDFKTKESWFEAIKPFLTEIAKEDLLRILTGPLVNRVIQFAVDEDGIGNRVRSKREITTDAQGKEKIIESKFSGEKMAEFLLDSVKAFNYDEYGGGDYDEGLYYKLTKDDRDPKEISIAIAQAALATAGMKSGYETPNEIISKVEERIAAQIPTDIALQDQIGLSDAQKRALKSEFGREAVENGTFENIPFLTSLLEDTTTSSWDDIANDIKNNIERYIEKENIIPLEDQEQLRLRIKERLERAKSPFATYTLRMKRIDEEELKELEELEKQFINGAMTYYNPYTKKEESINSSPLSYSATFRMRSRLIKKENNDQRAIVRQSPEYEEVKKLFEFSRKSIYGGKLTYRDVDVFNYAKTSYLDKLYFDKIEGQEKRDSIVDEKTGELNWEKRDVKVEEWKKNMQTTFPSLTNFEIDDYLYRVQDNERYTSPPLLRAMEDMQEQISESGYYEIGESIINTIQKGLPNRSEEIGRTYSIWKSLVGSDKTGELQGFENQMGNQWIKESFIPKLENKKIDFIFQNKRIEAMLRIISSSKTKKARTDWGIAIDVIMEKNNRNPMGEEKMLDFFQDILDETITLDEIKAKYY